MNDYCKMTIWYKRILMGPDPIFHALANHPPLKMVEFLGSCNKIVVAGKSGYLDFLTFEPRFSMTCLKVTKTAITCMKLDTKTGIVAVGDKNGNLILVSPDHQSILKSAQKHNGTINDIAINPESNIIVTASNDRSVRFFKIPELTLLSSIQLHPGWVTSVDYISNGKQIITSCNDRKIRIFNAQTHSLLRIIQNIPSIPTAVCSDFKTKSIYVGMIDGSVHNINRKGQIKKSFQPHKSVVTSVKIHEDQQLMLTSSDDSRLCVFDLKQNALAMTLEAHHIHVSRVSWCQDGIHFASCDRNGHVFIWEMPPVDITAPPSPRLSPVLEAMKDGFSSSSEFEPAPIAHESINEGRSENFTEEVPKPEVEVFSELVNQNETSLSQCDPRSEDIQQNDIDSLELKTSTLVSNSYNNSDRHLSQYSNEEESSSSIDFNNQEAIRKALEKFQNEEEDSDLEEEEKSDSLAYTDEDDHKIENEDDHIENDDQSIGRNKEESFGDERPTHMIVSTETIYTENDKVTTNVKENTNKEEEILYKPQVGGFRVNAPPPLDGSDDDSDDFFAPIGMTQEEERPPLGSSLEPRRIEGALRQVESQLQLLSHTVAGMMRRAELAQNDLEKLFRNNGLL